MLPNRTDLCFPDLYINVSRSLRSNGVIIFPQLSLRNLYYCSQLYVLNWKKLSLRYRLLCVKNIHTWFGYITRNLYISAQCPFPHIPHMHFHYHWWNAIGTFRYKVCLQWLINGCFSKFILPLLLHKFLAEVFLYSSIKTLDNSLPWCSCKCLQSIMGSIVGFPS